MPSTRELTRVYKEAHNIMRNVDGLQPQEAFDELLKYLFFKQNYESTPNVNSPPIDSVRKQFSSYLGEANSWSSSIWREKEMFLSDECLSDIHDLLFPIHFSKIDYDIRSQALREFLTPELRKGLGIFLTPDDVVSAIVNFVPCGPRLKILDPACGSGTFLIEYLKRRQPTRVCEVHGTDKNPRMLLLADLNLGHLAKVRFKRQLADSLASHEPSNYYDVVVTNPPFGVSLDARDYDFSRYLTCKDAHGYSLKRQSSEIVFIENCLQQLKPGGTLAIVIPKSIATNSTLQTARKALGEYGYIYAIMSLPPETFASTGTQTVTIVLFARKYKDDKEKNEPIKLALANVTNVGFDSTGRSREGNELPFFSKCMETAIDKEQSDHFIELIHYDKKSTTFSGLSEAFISKPTQNGCVLLGEICSFIGTGRTPARSGYAESGNFLIKVGNLTGSGINWEARDRNFVGDEEINRRLKAKKPLTLVRGDILLTSSAHSPVYIAKKSDIFTGVPAFLESDVVSFVGEVMLIRVDEKLVDPYTLLAFLRSNKTVTEIQKMVRGQTAHLHPSDIARLAVPREVFETGSRYDEASKVIKEQNRLNDIMSNLMAEQASLLDGTVGTWTSQSL